MRRLCRLDLLCLSSPRCLITSLTGALFQKGRRPRSPDASLPWAACWTTSTGTIW